MDAVKFIEERNRMCAAHIGCRECPAFQPAADVNTCRFSIRNGTGAEVQVRIVEEWTATHPRKTRQSVFLEQWPDADRDKKGVIAICPKYVDRSVTCERDNAVFMKCEDCRHEFWMQEVE